MSESFGEEDRKRIAALGWRDPIFFLKFFLNDWYPRPVPWVHRALVAIYTRKTDFLLNFDEHYSERHLDKIVRHFTYKADPDDEKSADLPIFHPIRDEAGKLIRVDLEITKFTMVMMPRGFSKTTLINGVVIWLTVYQVHKFPVYVSETQTHAERQLMNVRTQLETNVRLRGVFGDLKPPQRASDGEAPLQWTSDILQTTTGVTIGARGRGGQIRGFNVNAQRPDFIILDDVEDKESVATSVQREKTKDWAYGDLIPALPRMDPDAAIIALGTLLHSEALLMNWLHDPDWTSVILGAEDNDGEALWADNMSLATIERTKLSYQRVGKLSTFYLEFFNRIRSDESAKFREDMFIYINSPVELLKALMIDPAISDANTADYCAFGVVGMEEKGIIHVLEADGKVGMSVREQVDRYFELYRIWTPQKCGVETIAYQRALVHLLREEMFRKRLYFEIEKVGSHTQAKDARILGILQPRYAAGYIRHARRFPLLETQLLDFPRGKKDLPDVLAMAIALLDPYAAQAADPTKDLAEDEYDPIEKVAGGFFKSSP